MKQGYNKWYDDDEKKKVIIICIENILYVSLLVF